MSNSSKSRCPKCNTPIPEGAPHNLCPQCVMADVSAATQEDTRIARQATAPPAEDLAAAFPDFEIKELIGQGGMGFVYRAHQTSLDRDVALKVLPEELADQPGFSDRFAREGRLLAKLSHQNIVTVFDFGKNGAYYFLSMEFVDGVNLRQAMQAGRFTPEQALVIVPKVCEALQYAHEQGVLHRDIKPENILMDSDGDIKIADFGIAKMLGDNKGHTGLTRSGARVGTPHYMAPEQVEAAASVDHRADIYSLGVVFYELLTGELPIGRFEPPSSRTALDARLDEVVLRALEKDRERRQQSAREIKTQVEEVQHPSNEASVPSPQPTISPETARGRLLAPAIAMGFVALVNLWRSFPISPTGVVGHSGDPWITTMLHPLSMILITIAGFLGYASIKMAQLEHRGVALLGGVVTVISFPWTMVGFPIGIWVLSVLNSPEIKNAYPDAPRPSPTPGNPWPRRIFYLVVVILIVPVVLIGLSLLVASWSYAGLRAPNSGSPVTEIQGYETTDGTQKIDIDDGTLTLLGVAKHQDPDQQWFKPEGSPFTSAGVTNESIKVSADDSEQAVEFLLRLDQLPEGVAIIDWEANPPFSTLGYGPVTRENDSEGRYGLLAGVVANDAENIQLIAYIARGEFTDVADCAAQSLQGNQYANQAGQFQEQSFQVTFSCPHHDEEGTTIVLAHNEDRNEFRLVAKDNEGKLHQSTTTQRGAQHLTAQFEGLPLDQIDRLYAQIRLGDKVMFPSVTLPR